MKTKKALAAFCMSFVIVASCTKVINDSNKNQIDLSKFPEAEAYIAEQVELCGPGVVEGIEGENTCGFTFKIDENLITHQEKTGLLHDEDWPFQTGQTWFSPASSEDPPATFDLRDELKVELPSPRQQKCGDCWAWATHHAMETVRALREGVMYDQSIQTILSCSRHGSCGGGYMSAPLFLVDRGIPLEPEFPYTGRDSSCKFSSNELNAGWDAKPFAAPSVGGSLSYSRFFRGNYSGLKVSEMTKALFSQKTPLIVTVAAYSSNSGVVDSCSSINSRGNHMVTITGWRDISGKRVAHVHNSWGQGHGDGATTEKGINTPGISSIVWECGDNRLNRGLGYSARILQYDSPCQPPEAFIGSNHYMILQGSSVKLGKPQAEDVNCKWSPSVGLSDANSCETYAEPNASTEYHLTATNDCGTSSAMTLVEVWTKVPTNGKYFSEKQKLITPHGVVNWNPKTGVLDE